VAPCAPATAAAAPCPAAPQGHCFTLTVPLDRSGAVPGKVRLRAVRIRSRHATRPPLIGLTGGPGQAGVVYASTYDYILPTAGRDLVMLDQRGTGASGLLRCPSVEGDVRYYSKAAQACGRRLGARRAFYTSADSADDLEALRIRLGVPRIALFAVSYGTRVAIEYARRYPARVERMILDSPVAPDAPDSLARETIGAVARVLRTVCRNGCHGAEQHPVSDMRRLVRRLRRAPIRRLVRRGSRRVAVSVRVDDLLGLLLAGDFDAEFLREIPPAVRSALRGNDRPLVRLKISTFGGGSEPVGEFDPAVYVATTCEESVLAWDSNAGAQARREQARAALDATPAAALEPFDRPAALSFGLLGLCGRWPARERVVAPAPPLPSSVRTLILSGDLDLRTPLENARRLAGLLHGRVVVERGAGHSVLGLDPNGCATPAVKAFLVGRPLPTCKPRGAILTVTSAAVRAAVVWPGLRMRPRLR
jgi:pimeloyl-ACP methyl ester carboxylesterase